MRRPDRRRQQQLLVNRRQRLLLADSAPVAPSFPGDSTYDSLVAKEPILMYSFRDASGGFAADTNGVYSGAAYDLSTTVGVGSSIVYQQTSGDQNPAAGEFSASIGTVGDAGAYNNTGSWTDLAASLAGGGCVTIAFNCNATSDEHCFLNCYTGGGAANQFRIFIDPASYEVDMALNNSSAVAVMAGGSTTEHIGLQDQDWHIITLRQPSDGTGAYFIVDGVPQTTKVSVGGQEDFWLDSVAGSWDHILVGFFTQTASPTSGLDELNGFLDFVAFHPLMSEADVVTIHKQYHQLVDMTVGNDGTNYGYLSGSYGAIDQEPFPGSHTLTGVYVTSTPQIIVDFNGQDINAGGSLALWVEGFATNQPQLMSWNGANSRYERTTNASQLLTYLTAQNGNDLKVRIVKS